MRGLCTHLLSLTLAQEKMPEIDNILPDVYFQVGVCGL